MHRSPFLVLPLAAALVLQVGCGSSRLTTRDASQKLKPVAPLPEREQRMLPANLIVRIDNVADAGASYRNYAVLFINGKEIAPDEPENNLQTTYTYSLRLQPGIYDVKAEYHVVGFWKEHVYDIVTDEPVKVLPDQRTELTIRLDKDARGFPRKKESLFSIRYAPLTREAVAELAADRPFVRYDDAPEVVSKAPVVLPAEPVDNPPAVVPPAAGSSPSTTGQITLQINTVPIGADVYVDDRYVGQSPVRVTVSAGEGHVIQIYKEGYREFLKVLDVRELQAQKDRQIIVRLEAR